MHTEELDTKEREWDWLLHRVRWVFTAVGLTLIAVGLLNDGPWHVLAGAALLVVGIVGAVRYLRYRSTRSRRLWAAVFVLVLAIGLLIGLVTGAGAALQAALAGVAVGAALVVAGLVAPEDADA